jgi:hypothetical protein
MIQWSDLGISNHAKFSALEHLNSRLTDIQNSISAQNNIREAMNFYLNTVYDGIEYMYQALEILGTHSVYVTNPSTAGRLNTFLNDTVDIVKDASKFLNPSERLPLEGKIQSFKDLYVKDFYYPAHEKNVGKKVDWKVLENAESHDISKKILSVIQINCIVDNKFAQCRERWKTLLALRCFQVDVAQIYKTPFCTHCSFMKTAHHYPLIQKETASAEEKLEEIYNEYSQIVVSEIRNNIKNLALIDCPEKQKNAVQKIADTQVLPEKTGRELIDCINQLFKNFAIVELQKDKEIRELFRDNELLTIEQLRKAFINLENRIIKQGINSKENDIRIRFV